MFLGWDTGLLAISDKSTAVILPITQPTPKTEFAKWRAEKARQAPIVDEYSRYCQGVCCPVEVYSITWWWMEPTQRAMCPNLSVMAYRLDAETIETLECLKSWLRSHCTTWLADS